MPTFRAPDNDTDHESQAPSDHHPDSDIELEDRPEEMATPNPQPQLTDEQWRDKILALEAEIANLRNKKKEHGKILRPKRPDSYDGEPRKMEKYFMELDVYFGYFPDTLEEDEDKTIFAITCLTGAAEEWARPIMQDFKANEMKNWKDQTKEIFDTHAKFRDQLKKSFGTSNEEQEAERDLRLIMQRGALSKHTTTFLRLLTKVNWTEDTKKEAYYRSLKSKVKDELFKIDRKKTSFIDYTQTAIDIDNRIWEREQEKKEEKPGNFQPKRNPQYQANHGRKRQDYVASSNDGKPGPMEWTANTLKEARKNVECYNCGKKGHIKKYCRSPKKEGNQEFTPVPEPKGNKTINTMKTLNTLSECYDEDTNKDDNSIPDTAPRASPKHEDPLEGLTAEEIEGLTAEEIETLENQMFKECGSTAPKGPYHPCKMTESDWEEYEHRYEIAQIQEENERYDEEVRQKELQEQWSKLPRIDLSTAYDRIQLPGNEFRTYVETNATEYPIAQALKSTLYYVDDIMLIEQCNEANLANCKLLLCKQHAIRKLAEWHEDHDHHDCGQKEFTLCKDELCVKHSPQRRSLRIVVHNLHNQGYDLWKHTGEARWHDIRKYHKLTNRDVPKPWCTWCERYNIREDQPTWLITDLDNIDLDTNEEQDDTSEYSEYPEQPWDNDAYDGIDDAIHNLNTIHGRNQYEFLVPGKLEGNPISVYIDSGASHSFIAPQLVNRLQLNNRKKEKPYPLGSIESQRLTYNNGMVDRETDHLAFQFSDIVDSFQFDITNIAGYDILLGYDWLRTRNPDIDWVRGHAKWRTRAQPTDIPAKL